ncbi:hypothetical protein [Martelella mediterranea]|uniref:Uncharacterized protein n=1 Tax=Martelella mediterranea TaxID=293089 RepID=A0A4R3NV60_9HYPH|nr:hypothetical protein [Martelella mediterranea]TCT42016.1 hypothetical protein EDC90_100531 [Martelella mediterranea]
MGRFLVLAAIAGGGYMLYRKFINDAEALSARGEQKRAEQKNGATGTLVKDPVTGEYRVKKAD